jgi:kynurenine formamidase
MATFDLSQSVESGMQTYPGDPPVRAEPHADFDADGYRVTALAMGTHTGTHVDAPSHTEEDGATLGSFPLDAFRFDAQLADVRVGARTPVSVATLPDPTDADLLVLHTGWDDHWGTDRARDHPFLTRDAAAWCVDHGYHVATDALSVDPTPSPNARADEPTGFGAHHALLGAGRLVYENLRGLDRLPSRFRLHAYPLAIDADGSPVRAVAVTEE